MCCLQECSSTCNGLPNNYNFVCTSTTTTTLTSSSSSSTVTRLHSRVARRDASVAQPAAWHMLLHTTQQATCDSTAAAVSCLSYTAQPFCALGRTIRCVTDSGPSQPAPLLLLQCVYSAHCYPSITAGKPHAVAAMCRIYEQQCPDLLLQTVLLLVSDTWTAHLVMCACSTLAFTRLHTYTYNTTHSPHQVVLIADGQITAGPKIVKPSARKLRRLATEPLPSLGGFAGMYV